MKVVLTLLVWLCCFVLVNQEEEYPIKEFLEKVQEKLYFPQDFGLKDLKAIVIWEPFSTKGMLPKVEVTLYWKHPNKWKLVFAESITEGLKIVGRELKSDHLEVFFIPKKPLEIYREMKDTWKFELKKENKQYVLTCTPTEKTKHLITEIKWIYDRDYLLVKHITTTKEGATTLSDIKYITKGKKKLVSECILTGETKHAISKWLRKLSYNQIDKIWLLEKMIVEIEAETEELSMSQTWILTIKDPQINKGIDDQIFVDKPEEEPKEDKENKTALKYLQEVKGYILNSYIFKEEVSREELTKGAINAIKEAINKGEFPKLTEEQKKAVLDAVDEDSLENTIRAIGKLKEENINIDIIKLADIAAEGMVKILGDPYAEILTVKEYYELIDMIGGTGIVLHEENGKFVIRGVIYGYSAYFEDIQKGNELIEVNGRPVKGKKFMEVVRMIIRTALKEPLKLKIYRPAHKKSYEFTLKHRNLPDKTVFSTTFGEDIGYIRLTGFKITSTQEFKDALKDLKQKGVKGIVLDLRNNPGGEITVAIAIADMFLPQNLVVTKTKSNSEFFVYGIGEQTFKTKRRYEFEEMPLVVLVNHESMSASECLAGALQDYKRAVIIGETTFGKGVGQSHILLISMQKGKRPQRYLKLTTFKYDLPSGRNINKIGIKPDKINQPPQYTAEEFSEVLRIRYSDAMKEHIETLFKQHPQLTKEIMHYDGFDTASYPDFDALYKKLETTLSKDMVRITLRDEIRKKFIFDMREEIPCDLGSDPQLQEALSVLIDKIK